jgi:hypothetical protein
VKHLTKETTSLSPGQIELITNLREINRNKIYQDHGEGIMDIDELSDWSEDSDNLAAEHDIEDMFNKAHGQDPNGGFNKVATSQLG